MDQVKYIRLGSVFGIAGVLTYTLTIIAAMSLFPVSFSPLESTISHLGNATVNPEGAAIFNAGNILAGLILAPFVSSLALWGAGRKLENYLLIAAGIAGLGLSVGLILIGFYPENIRQVHVMSAVFVFLCLTIMLLLTNLALYQNACYPRWIALAGFVALLINGIQIGLYITSNMPTIVEWLSVFLPLVWVLLFAYNGLTVRSHDRSNADTIASNLPPTKSP